MFASFQQTYLVSKKKSYTRERWGFNKASVSSETDPQSPTFESNDIGIIGAEVDGTTGPNVTPAIGDTSPMQNSSNDVNLRPAKAEKPFSTNRLSKVLANVSFFESKVDGKDEDQTTEDVAKIGAQKASLRKRTPYLQVRDFYLPQII